MVGGKKKRGGGDPAPRPLDASPRQFAALWTGRYGIRENALDDIKNVVITQGENLAKQMTDDIEKANRPDRSLLYSFIVLGGFIGLMALSDFLVNH